MEAIVDGRLYKTDGLDVNIQDIIDKINRAAAGENVPGVFIAHLPDVPKEDTEEASTGFSLTNLLLLGGLAFVLLKPRKKS